MKKIITLSIFVSFTSIFLTACGDSNKKDANSEQNITEIQNQKSENLFDTPQELADALSKNGIGELKEWSNPMEMGWGTLTDYFQFGPQKDSVGMQNNIAYYIEGDKDKAIKMYVNLNINNPSEKSNALKFLNETAEKTFKTLKLEYPKELSSAILNGKNYQTEIGDFKVSNVLDKSKIETWKVNIERK